MHFNEKGHRVLVTGLGGGGHGEQVLKALRLSAVPFDIIGADRSELCANKPRVSSFHLLPPANHPNYLNALKTLICEQQPTMVIHGSEPEMRIMSQYRDEIEALGTYLPVNNHALLTLCMDKAATFEKLAAVGFDVPAFARLTNKDDLKHWDLFPVVIKPSVGGGGSANTFIAQTPGELAFFGTHCLSLAPEVVLQEYVGTADQEYTAGVLFDRAGKLLNSIVVHRVINSALTTRLRVPNITNRTTLGAELVISSGVSQGQVGKFPPIAEQCEAIAKALKPDAPINLQFRWVDNEVKLFEINPRFSGTTSLRALCGYNEPETLFRVDVLGEAPPKPYRYQEAMILRALDEFKIGPIE